MHLGTLAQSQMLLFKSCSSLMWIEINSELGNMEAEREPVRWTYTIHVQLQGEAGRVSCWENGVTEKNLPEITSYLSPYIRTESSQEKLSGFTGMSG